MTVIFIGFSRFKIHVFFIKFIVIYIHRSTWFFIKLTNFQNFLYLYNFKFLPFNPLTPKASLTMV
ncbi:hypothetical protein LDVICp036 [lymphocystis disease virus-China]|uniref:Uncharacterized protein n=1 Tax=lymphocystis disease virus-China TaxID=256729 RepID=Q678H4_9VIRU|nr:hypothetical protein LDVICp036 [lymphocystis disease virus-China]AAU10883.1 hypothetical protein [lymphocystis disease virus-China]